MPGADLALGHGRVLWDFNAVPQKPAPADLMIVMGTDDLGVPATAAQVARDHGFRAVVATGGVRHDRSSRGAAFGGTEAEVFQAEMRRLDCPCPVLLEDEARNTGENITRTRALLQRRGIAVTTGLLVHTPGMQRRALATAQQQWPEVRWRVTGQRISYDAYLQDLDQERFLRQLTGDSYRLLLYPKLGYQVAIAVPEPVQASIRALAALGFLTRPAIATPVEVWPGTGF